ncbi:EAL domain-containing protein [Catenovulum adriaticum]|uniref:EAL domain-containing protein n=1 Tax=Catenovulum adriaticum TaxID=2984846 RepID=A0ABY7AI19_9ALTE|nr:EAL domain-containing protein [Catenovulum sp. TS8]WAJ69243.1 EAL domain-containing protein [Catenovulum sp. TS8]
MLSFVFYRALSNLYNSNQAQLTEQQFVNLQHAEQVFQARFEQQALSVATHPNESKLLSNSASFMVQLDSKNTIYRQTFLTKEGAIAHQLPLSFIDKLNNAFVNNTIKATCCGYTKLASNTWARVGLSQLTDQSWLIYGELIDTDTSLIKQISAYTSRPDKLSGLNVQSLLFKDFFKPADELEIQLKPLHFAQIHQQPLWLIFVAICVLTVLAFVLVIILKWRDPKQNLDKLKQEIMSIKPLNSTSNHKLGSTNTEDTAELAESINAMLDELYETREFNKVVLNSIGDAVIATDLKGVVTYCNAATYQIIPVDESELIGQPVSQVLPFVNRADIDKLNASLTDVIRQKNEGAGERYTHEFKRNLEILFVEKHITLLRNSNHESVGTVMVLRDMTQSERLRQKLNFQASYDVVTKLLNRHKYEEQLNFAVHSAKTDKREHILCQIDLDRFKLINDNAGHAAGDQLLHEIGAILRSFLRKTDICARIGGDEYGIILFDARLKHGLAIIEKIHEHIKSYRFIWAGKVYSVGASFGLTEVNQSTHNSAEARREADAACYLSKSQGPNHIQVFDSANEHLNSHHQAPQWAAKINDALINDKFELFFQRINPTVGKSEREHVEILLRMRDEAGILLAPGLFLPAAERFRLMSKIDRWVIKSVFTWLSSRPSIWDSVTLSINLSGESLNDGSLYGYIIDLHQKVGFPSESICFEVTESAAVNNLVTGRELILRLKAYGFTFALDDFGKGFSSYSYLQNLPAEYVKIDGGFVKEMISNKRDHEIVRSIHQISNAMGMKTIAEYVEDDEILEALREIGVDYAQGFGIQRPAQLKEFKPVAEIISNVVIQPQADAELNSEVTIATD